MKRQAWLLLVGSILMSGCAATRYSLVTPGVVAVQDLTVEAGSGWNRAPAATTPAARKTSETWTRDGLLLDRLVIVPGVADGEALLVSRDKAAALPVFRSDMLPNELEELVESTMLKVFGEGQSVVRTENLRPHRFGDNRGIMMDLTVTVTDSPQYNGIVGAFIANQKLYLMYFLGAVPYYFEKHRAEAEAIIGSAIRSPT